MGDLARILIYGDIHLNSKNYGAHLDYAKESLDCFRKITKAAEGNNATHLIGLGDFTYGRFHSLEYRESVENELMRQYEITDGRHYALKGNHDSAGYGMTEYEYYIKKGLIKPGANMSIGSVNITMIDYGEHNNVIPCIGKNDESINIALAHDYFRFKDTQLPELGKFIELDTFDRWFGIDYLICGHIHNQFAFDGLITKTVDGQTLGHRMMVQYVGTLTRPAYRAGYMNEVGNLVLLVVKENGDLEYNVLDIELPPLEESFNLAVKEAEKRVKEEKEKRVDISDIIEQLNSHERNVGNPEDIISSMIGIDERYKQKAISLLRDSLS